MKAIEKLIDECKRTRKRAAVVTDDIAKSSAVTKTSKMLKKSVKAPKSKATKPVYVVSLTKSLDKSRA